MNFYLAYGHEELQISVPDGLKVDVIAPFEQAPSPDPQGQVETALSAPLGTFRFDNFRNCPSVAIIINDKTRPVPHEILLPPLLNRLSALGIPDEAIILIIASGTHIPMPPDEFHLVLPGDILSRYSVIAHNSDDSDLVNLGQTAHGTPIFMNRRFFEAKLRIVLGNIEPHHFMGFSGGVKSAVIGVAGRETINHNHAMLPHPMAKAGHYEDNPMRQDVEEMGDRVGIHLALNAILNSSQEIIAVLAGSPRMVMEQGTAISRALCQRQVPYHYDLVIASAGGYPKDINFYQSQKALTHAAMLSRPGGTVILLAACEEGIGNLKYEQFMQGIKSIPEVFEKFKAQGFEVGPHKAFLVARDASRSRIILISSLSARVVETLLLTPANTFSEAFQMVAPQLSHDSRVAIMPIAVITIPDIQEN